ncbi:MAG: AMP-binding protein [Bacteroidota bacterium]
MSMKGEILALGLYESFMAHADNIAIQSINTQYSYADLLQAAAGISNGIPDMPGIKSPVGILGSKSFYTYAGICAALFASRPYMPLNMKFPPSRNVKMLELSGADIIVADSTSDEMLAHILTSSSRKYTIITESDPALLAESYPDHQFTQYGSGKINMAKAVTASPEDIAYLLFTSGTTGNPKGVPVSNGNVMAYVNYMLEAWDFSEDDRFSQTFDLTFDLSVHDMMLCWMSGARLCIPEEDSAFRMAAYIRQHEISVWFSVPSMAILMHKMRLLKAGAYNNIRISFFCGEALPSTVASKWQESTDGHEVVNLYGPSEATIAITAYKWDEGNRKSVNDIVCIGKIFPQQEYCLLDHQKKVVDGKGELCLGGTQIIDGYLDDTALSGKYFIELEQYPGKKWYRTGDLVEKDGDGDLYFLGRLDSEVKISGYRVNLFEVDTLLRKITGTDLLASILDDRGTARIVSFVSSGSSMEQAEVIRRCREELPWYMIPEVIIFVDEMPLNANGKIDRNKLKQKLHE